MTLRKPKILTHDEYVVYAIDNFFPSLKKMIIKMNSKKIKINSIVIYFDEYSSNKITKAIFHLEPEEVAA